MRVVGAATAFGLATALVACAAADPTSGQGTGGQHHPSSPIATPQVSATGTVVAALGRLSVKGRAPMTGYDRDQFGPAWLDANRNGCDTRNDMLARNLTHVVFEPGTHDCVVESGDLADGYTATAIHFVYGDGALVDIDHVVALGNAWATGAFRWPIRERAALANDPLNLLPVDASANRQKGDSDAASWLPPNKTYRCAYVARQVTVKTKFDLWVTPPEKAAMERVLGRCPDEPLLKDSGTPILVPVHVVPPTSPSPSHEDGTSNGSVYYENCDAARAAGAAPLHRGDPGYGAHLDGDGDGVACE